MNPELQKAKEERFFALNHSLQIVEKLAVSTLSPEEFEHFKRIQTILRNRYKV